MNLKKRNNVLFFGFIVLLIILFSVYKYIYKPPKKTEEIEVVFVGNTKDFLLKINTESDKWITKVIQLKGRISSIEDEGLLLDGNTFCQFENKSFLTKLKKDQIVTIKGAVIGFDDLFNELKLNQCIIIEQ